MLITEAVKYLDVKVTKAFKHSPLQITLVLLAMKTIRSVINIIILSDVQCILQAVEDVKCLIA